jgi:hypothetical protein
VVDSTRAAITRRHARRAFAHESSAAVAGALTLRASCNYVGGTALFWRATPVNTSPAVIFEKKAQDYSSHQVG